MPGRKRKGVLNDLTVMSSNGETAFEYRNNSKLLDTSMYSRFFMFGKADAMGRFGTNRGFRDTNQFSAMTSDP